MTLRSKSSSGSGMACSLRKGGTGERNGICPPPVRSDAARTRYFGMSRQGGDGVTPPPAQSTVATISGGQRGTAPRQPRSGTHGVWPRGVCGTPEIQITAGDHVSSYRTARSALPALEPHRLPPYSNGGEIASIRGNRFSSHGPLTAAAPEPVRTLCSPASAAWHRAGEE